MIKTRNLNKWYHDANRQIMVLQNININIDRNDFVALLGPSGSGKTTLLTILGLIDSPSGGEIYFDGQEVSGFSDRAREKLRRGNMGFVFENHNLIDELTVFENVELPLLYLPFSARERGLMVDTTLERFKLIHRKKHYPKDIDHTLQQKTALARATVFNPKVIFADEPTGNLNASGSDELAGLFSMLSELGQTIVMTTHSPSLARSAQRVIQLYDGHVVSSQKEELL